MKIQNHIKMISWSLLDKALFILYGFIFVLMINYADPVEYALYSILIAFHTWIFTISDSFALQSLIQFGMKSENRRKVNFVALLNHSILTLGIASLIYIFRNQILYLFDKPKLENVIYLLPLLTITFIPKAFGQKLIYRDQKMFQLFITNLVFFGVNSIYIIYLIYLKKNLNFQDLALSYIYSSATSSIITIFLTRKELIFGVVGDIKIKEIFMFNWKMTVGSLLYAVPRQMDTIILTAFFNLNIIGIYSAAKTLFRVFDEALNALAALLYPSAVKHVNNNNDYELETLITKTFSVGFFTFFFIYVTLFFGGSGLIEDLPIIPDKYKLAINYFNILIISLPVLPFTAIYLINIAKGRIYEYFLITTIGVIAFFITSFIVGFNHYEHLISLGLLSFYLTEGIIGFFYSKKLLNIKYSSIFRVFKDVKNYLKRK